MKTYYTWRILTKKGKLIDPTNDDTIYKSNNLNNKSFKTETEAIDRFETYLGGSTTRDWLSQFDFVLVKIYKM